MYVDIFLIDKNNYYYFSNRQGYDFLGKMFISIGEHMTTTEQTNKVMKYLLNITNTMNICEE